MRKRIRRLVVLGVFLLLIICAVGFIKFRAAQRAAAIGDVPLPTNIQPLENSSGATGRFDVDAEYVGIGTDNTINVNFTWDDDWFFEDSSTYNHELATACSVLSAAANQEGDHYIEGSDAEPYMENIFAKLGFEYCDTSSYTYRSSAVDEIVNIFEGETNVTAYSIASKHLTNSTTGEQKLLIVVSVRGTYGSEWFGNLDATTSVGLLDGYTEEGNTIENSSADGTSSEDASTSTNTAESDSSTELSDEEKAKADALEEELADSELDSMTAGDYTGFSKAGIALTDAVIGYFNKLYPNDDFTDVAVLYTGHSRGGATTALATAYMNSLHTEMERFDSLLESYVESTETVSSENSTNTEEISGFKTLIPSKANTICYTFATPTHTKKVDCHSDTYSNIFNILYPCDIVPRMPLAAWGYGRYGTDLYLPEEGMDGFGEMWEAVMASYKKAMGAEFGGSTDSAEVLDRVLVRIFEDNPTVEDFMSIGGLINTIRTLASQCDIIQIIWSHIPNLYISWMQTIDASALRTAR